MPPQAAGNGLGIEGHDQGGHSPRAGPVGHAHVIADHEAIEHALSAVGFEERCIGETHSEWLPTWRHNLHPIPRNLDHDADRALQVRGRQSIAVSSLRAAGGKVLPGAGQSPR